MAHPLRFPRAVAVVVVRPSAFQPWAAREPAAPTRWVRGRTL